MTKKPHKCIECEEPMSKTTGDHAYGYDKGKKIQLRGMTTWKCACGRHEIEIPRMGPLHETIKKALSLHVKRENLSFFFKHGKKGVEDGAWGVSVLSSGPKGAAR